MADAIPPNVVTDARRAAAATLRTPRYRYDRVFRQACLMTRFGTAWLMMGLGFGLHVAGVASAPFLLVASVWLFREATSQIIN